METRKLTLVMYLVLSCVLVFTLGLLGGCKGSDGSAGAQGPQGIQGPQGLTGPTGTQGLPGTFANNNCTDCHHLSADGSTALLPQRAAGMAGGAKVVSTGTTTTLKATATILVSGATVTINGYYWQYIGGLPATLGTTVTGQTVTITMNAVAGDYRAKAVENEMLPDRTMVVPINSKTMEEGANAELLLTAFGSDGNIYYDTATVKDSGNDVATYAPRETTGVNNVAVGMPVLLNAEGTGPYTWTLTNNPAGSTAAFDASNIKNPYFTPNVAGKYTVSVVTTPTGTTTPATDTMDIYAGSWRGEITGVDMTTLTADGNGTPIPDSTSCTGCHDGTIAPDKFTPWKSSGHATRFEEGLNAGGHYSAVCFPCHTVGFNTGAAANGFDLQPNYATFVTDTTMFGPAVDNTRYSRMWSTPSYTALAKESNIQCENCHGPQNTAGHMNVAGAPRVSLSSDVCAACHAEPTHHGRFQEWQESPTGHANFTLAEGEGTNPNCAGCHSAQGNLVWIKQLQSGNPLRTLAPGSITWTTSNVQPQTCVVCHDPHAEGTTTNTTTDAQPRITGDTPKLPAGFAALGVGKGAQCIVCHNTRNGGITTAGDSYLHEDNDPQFGALSSYAAPHVPAQGDVLTGHNAYFMPASGGAFGTTNYSPHARITDSCVQCHMVRSLPPALLSDYGNTNHTFLASLDICTKCHGIDSGLAGKLQMDTQAALDQLLSNIQTAIATQATGTYAGNIASVTLATSHGLPVVNLTYVAGSPATGVNPNVVVPASTDAGQTLAKAIWNYYLINNDSSLGIHNPEFIRNVIGNTNTKVSVLLP